MFNIFNKQIIERLNDIQGSLFVLSSEIKMISSNVNKYRIESNIDEKKDFDSDVRIAKMVLKILKKKTRNGKKNK